jgi:hypothetical protein
MEERRCLSHHNPSNKARMALNPNMISASGIPAGTHAGLAGRKRIARLAAAS